MADTNGSKVAVITGGSAGIGRATVREFANAGYDVAILARGQAGIDGAASDVEKAGGRALPISVVQRHMIIKDIADAARYRRHKLRSPGRPSQVTNRHRRINDGKHPPRETPTGAHHHTVRRAGAKPR